MKRPLLLVHSYTRRAFLEWSAFRSFLLTLVLNQAVAPFLGLAIWSAALPDRADISGYFVALLAVQLVTVSQEYYSVTLRIYEGHLADDLLRPHPFVMFPLGECLAFRIWNGLAGLPLVVIAAAVTGTTFQVADVLLALPALVMAGALRFLFVFTLALSALWIEEASAVTEVGSTLVFLLGGLAVPISVFPDRFRPLGEALPFRAMLGFPAEVASGGLDTTQVLQGYAWQVLWLGVFSWLAFAVWQAGVRRFTAVGG